MQVRVVIFVVYAAISAAFCQVSFTEWYNSGRSGSIDGIYISVAVSCRSREKRSGAVGCESIRLAYNKTRQRPLSYIEK